MSFKSNGLEISVVDAIREVDAIAFSYRIKEFANGATGRRLTRVLDMSAEAEEVMHEADSYRDKFGLDETN